MKEMGKVARKFKAKTGTENNEVVELCLDVVQGFYILKLYEKYYLHDVFIACLTLYVSVRVL